MKTKSVILVILALLGPCIWARPPKRPSHVKPRPHDHSKCHYVVLTEDESDSSSDSDDFPDNEVPIVATAFPPKHIYDPFLDTEVPDGPYFNPNRIVDFIGIKHRFSNESNLAFPPYANIARRKSTKKNKKRNLKKHN
ncbi:uncharacterized protein LOC123009015, partial [Tribolium madens]|uniref:uncharacterized protein LOC123009015 n=1 Tax=Tribolium madens TaxID=41895 RepID=UPI001CF745FA